MKKKQLKESECVNRGASFERWLNIFGQNFEVFDRELNKRIKNRGLKNQL